ERRFDIAEPNIGAWRRAVCGDLTSAFDFATPDAGAATLPDTAHFIAAADAASHLATPVIPAHVAPALQQPGQRFARALPYVLDVRCEIDPAGRSVTLAFDNGSLVGAPFNVFGPKTAQETAQGAGPWFYTVEARKALKHRVLTGAENYDLSVFGPN